MGLYDGGEDIHYVLTVTEPMWINILFDPVETYSGIALKTECGDGGTCLFTYGEFANTLKDIKYEFTSAGTYYLMIDTWPSPPCVSFTMDIMPWIPPPPATPIVSFPFEEGFENCAFPPEIQGINGDRCVTSALAAAAYESDCGAQMVGTSYNWFYYNATCQLSINNNIPPSQGGTATGSYGQHWAKMVMDVEPDGTPGSMQLDFNFNFHANYDFGYYNAFQVWINGAPVMEKELQEDCFR
jgi:hypothetical protein